MCHTNPGRCELLAHSRISAIAFLESFPSPIPSNAQQCLERKDRASSGASMRVLLLRTPQRILRSGIRPGALSLHFAITSLHPVTLSQRIKTGSCERGAQHLHVESSQSRIDGALVEIQQLTQEPLICPGCGAYYQTYDGDQAGYYSSSRKGVDSFLRAHDASKLEEIPSRAILRSEASLQELSNPAKTDDKSGSGPSPLSRDDDRSAKEAPYERPAPRLPLCDRCHNLVHHGSGSPIIHPTLAAIREMIAESPHSRNHIYHVLDSADFPLSFIPQLHRELSLAPLRSRNRRAKEESNVHHGGPQVSYIITRSDLLAPTKEQVDTLMPYLVEVLRDALGPAGAGIRLGNVRCVSSKRGWWTKHVKEELWERGGAGWMVGKVNVGKSNLFECIFPKGHNQAPDADGKGFARNNLPLWQAAKHAASLEYESRQKALKVSETGQLQDLSSLLPPVSPEVPYPPMPLVSHLPGTTAFPIRLSYGQGKGELIDLPGLSRGNIEDHVLDEHKASLVMRHRIKARQYSIKPGQSFVVSNLVRITPISPEVTFLACPFVPLACHVTNTEKARAILAQENMTAVETITRPGVGETIASAGVFRLSSDVTKQRSGPLTSPSAIKLKPQQLPFIVYSTDVLIEGLGWVEVAVQVRKRWIEEEAGERIEDHLPEIEVFSPHGKHIGARRSMNGWVIGGRQRPPVSRRTKRPRRSMKGVKKMLKKRHRAENNV